MISLEQFLRKESQEDLLNYYDIDNVDEWLFETYEEYLNNHEHISESQFYHNKFNFSVLDMPEFWFWQDKLYERLDTSITIDSTLFGNLFKRIRGIEEVIIDNEYSIGLRYNDEFSEGSYEFQQLLNFANYYIRSKRNGKLPNPFFIEARKPKELIDYRYEKAYHITNKYAYEKIRKYGLVPKSKSKLSNYDYRNYNYRVYLWIPEYLDRRDIISYGHLSLMLWDASIKNNPKHHLYNKIDFNEIDIKNDIVVLEIDLKQFEEDHKKQLKLFGDPAYNKKSAVFTEEPIPTKYLQLCDNF